MPIAAYIIRSVVHPSLEELPTLAGIVTIRNLLSYFPGEGNGWSKPELLSEPDFMDFSTIFTYDYGLSFLFRENIIHIEVLDLPDEL